MILVDRYIKSTLAALVLLFGIMCNLCGQDRNQARSLEDLTLDGVAAYNREDYAGARALFAAVTDINPFSDAAFYYMGLCDMYLHNLKAAEAELREAVALDSSNYWYKDRLAVLYSLMGEDAKTMEIYESLLQDYPKKTDIHYSLINLYAKFGMADKLLATLDAIEGVQGVSEATVTTRYDVLMHMDRRDEAFGVLQKFCDEYASAAILSMMGDAKLQDFDDSEAMRYYSEALEYEPSYPPAILGMAEVHRMRREMPQFFDKLGSFVADSDVPVPAKGQYLENMINRSEPQFLSAWAPQIDSMMENLVIQAPKDTMVLELAGIYYYRSGNNAKAAEFLGRSWAENRNSVAAAATYIQILDVAGDWETMYDATEEAFALFPEEAAFLEYKAMAAYNLEHYDDMLGIYSRIISLFPHNREILVHAWAGIGDISYLQGRAAEAFRAYNKALKLDPFNAPVLNNYAYYLSLGGRSLKKAANMSKITVEQEPDNPTYLDTYGWILYLQGKAQDAKAYFKHAMLYGGKDSVTILDHYAEVLYSLGEYDLAKVYWNQAKQKNNGEIPDLEERIAKKMEAVK